MVTSGAVHDTGRRLWLSAADRRAIRQRCALAAELKLHSVSVLGSVWTLHHPRERHTQLTLSQNFVFWGPNFLSFIRREGTQISWIIHKISGAAASLNICEQMLFTAPSPTTAVVLL